MLGTPQLMTLSRPPKTDTPFRRVAILFAGGPAPAANAVISTGGQFVLAQRHRSGRRPERLLAAARVSRRSAARAGPRLHACSTSRCCGAPRNSQGILIGTARANPGKRHFASSTISTIRSSVAPLRTVYEALRSIGVDALVSIGGDDTLKTANKFKLFQDRLPADKPRMPVVHLPKTIDNDYMGIDFTFGYFTAVETLASEIRNLLADAEACRTYFLAETMGRSAGWLAYGAAIAGEASLVISVEDITGKYRGTGRGRRSDHRRENDPARS